ARRPTRNPQNRRDRLPAQNGPAPADGRLSPWVAGLISMLVAQTPARANRARSAFLKLPVRTMPACAASGARITRGNALPPLFLLIEPLKNRPRQAFP